MILRHGFPISTSSKAPCVRWVYLPEDSLSLSIVYAEVLGSIVVCHLALSDILPNPPCLLFDFNCSDFTLSPAKNHKYQSKKVA